MPETLIGWLTQLPVLFYLWLRVSQIAKALADSYLATEKCKG